MAIDIVYSMKLTKSIFIIFELDALRFEGLLDILSNTLQKNFRFKTWGSFGIQPSQLLYCLNHEFGLSKNMNY